MANDDPNNVPVLLALATGKLMMLLKWSKQRINRFIAMPLDPPSFPFLSGFMMLKQTPKARNQLKRVTKINYKPDEGDEFERSWLLLADIHIQVSLYSLSISLVRCIFCSSHCTPFF